MAMGMAEATGTAQRRGQSRRRLLAAAVTLGGGALAAACAGGSEGGPGARGAARGTVTFMSQQAGRRRPGALQAGGGRSSTPRAARCTIELQEGGGGVAEVLQKLVTTVAADTAPDLFWTHCYINPTLVKARIPADLGRLHAARPGLQAGGVLRDVAQGLRVGGEAVRRLAVGDHHRAAGQPRPVRARTGCPAGRRAGRGTTSSRRRRQLSRGAGSEQTWGVGASTDNFPIVKAWQEGGDLVDKTRTRWTLHETPAVEQVQWVADLVTRHRVWPERGADPGWNSGRVGMVVALSDYNPVQQGRVRVGRASTCPGARRA